MAKINFTRRTISGTFKKPIKWHPVEEIQIAKKRLRELLEAQSEKEEEN